MNTYVIPILLFCLVSCTPANNNAKESNTSSFDTAAAGNTESPSTGGAANKADSNALPMGNDTTILMVRNYLQTFYKADLAAGMDSADRKFCMYKVDLNGDNNNEIFVGLRGPYFCGSGGCTIILLNANGKPITKFTVTEPPVVIAKSTTNGWNDLVLYSGGKNRHVKFNGKTYPSNPSVLPAYGFAMDSLVSGLDYTLLEWESF